MVDVDNGKIGSEGTYSIKFDKGKVKIEVKHTHKSGSFSVAVEEDSVYFLDKLKAAIPGKVDDAIIEALKLALRMV